MEEKGSGEKKSLQMFYPFRGSRIKEDHVYPPGLAEHCTKSQSESYDYNP